MDFEKIKHIETSHGVNREQAEELYRLAKQSTKAILEIGSYKGRSTACLGLGSKDGNNVPVITIDPFTYTYQNNEVDAKYKIFLDNIKKAGVEDVVKVIPEYSDTAEVNEEIDLLFIDGCHEYKWVKHDLLKFEPLVVNGGWICLHDFHFPGTKQVFDEIIYPLLFSGEINTKGKEIIPKSLKYTNFKLIKSLIVMQKCG